VDELTSHLLASADLPFGCSILIVLMVHLGTTDFIDVE
jgi:hypothetical protein